MPWHHEDCGWEKETGIPTKERFICIVLEDIAKAYGYG
jgi:hypothetical protein